MFTAFQFRPYLSKFSAVHNFTDSFSLNKHSKQCIQAKGFQAWAINRDNSAQRLIMLSVRLSFLVSAG